MFDEEKLKKAQEGDLKSIEEICSSTWEPLYRFIYFKVQNREEAEEITQETYVKALSRIRSGDSKIDKYIGFLKTISLNILRDRWRKNKRWGASVGLETLNPAQTAVEDHAENSTQRTLIENALNRLSEDQRTVIELRIIKGYSVAETASIMNKKEGTIRVIQYRALKELASIINESGR